MLQLKKNWYWVLFYWNWAHYLIQSPYKYPSWIGIYVHLNMNIFKYTFFLNRLIMFKAINCLKPRELYSWHRPTIAFLVFLLFLQNSLKVVNLNSIKNSKTIWDQNLSQKTVTFRYHNNARGFSIKIWIWISFSVKIYNQTFSKIQLIQIDSNINKYNLGFWRLNNSNSFLLKCCLRYRLIYIF